MYRLPLATPTHTHTHTHGSLVAQEKRRLEMKKRTPRATLLNKLDFCLEVTEQGARQGCHSPTCVCVCVLADLTTS